MPVIIIIIIIIIPDQHQFIWCSVVEINKIMFLCPSTREEPSSTCPGVHNIPHRSMCKMLKHAIKIHVKLYTNYRYNKNMPLILDKVWCIDETTKWKVLGWSILPPPLKNIGPTYFFLVIFRRILRKLRLQTGLKIKLSISSSPNTKVSLQGAIPKQTLHNISFWSEKIIIFLKLSLRKFSWLYQNRTKWNKLEAVKITL